MQRPDCPRGGAPYIAGLGLSCESYCSGVCRAIDLASVAPTRPAWARERVGMWLTVEEPAVTA